MSKKTSEAAAVAAPEEASMKRSIQMKMFASDVQKAEVALAYQKTPEDLSSWQVPIGQIIGRVYEVNTRVFEVNGEPQERIYAVGEFEAVNYASGEVMESTTADLPSYYLEGIRGALARNNGAAVLLGVEIVLVATGKAIPYAYEVRNLIPREADNPLNRIKSLIAGKGKLRLPPPVQADPIDPPDAAPAALEAPADPAGGDGSPAA
jgi:hypothetical protein